MRLLLATMIFLIAACDSDSGPTGNSAPGLQAYNGQWLVVNYWAKWYKPCIEEIPELNKLDADNANIRVLGVNYDGLTGDALAAQVDELGVEFEVIPDPAGQLGSPRPLVLPTTLILTPKGKLVETLVGPQTRESLLAQIGRHQSAQQ